MTENKEQDVVPSPDQPRRAFLFEFKGERTTEGGAAEPTPAELFAALSMEEVVAYVRRHQMGVEPMELKVLGKVQVLSDSEHLE